MALCLASGCRPGCRGGAVQVGRRRWQDPLQRPPAGQPGEKETPAAEPPGHSSFPPPRMRVREETWPPRPRPNARPKKEHAENARLQGDPGPERPGLLLTFSSEEELKLARDDRIDVIDSVIGLINKSIARPRENSTSSKQRRPDLPLARARKSPAAWRRKSNTSRARSKTATRSWSKNRTRKPRSTSSTNSTWRATANSSHSNNIRRCRKTACWLIAIVTARNADYRLVL